MPNPLKYDDVKQLFAVWGATLISTIYINGNSPITYKCFCGSDEIATTTVKNWKNHANPPKCPNCPGQKGFPKRLSYEEVKKIFAEEGCELLSEQYINSKEKLWYSCSCNSDDVHEILLQDFRKGIRCKNCRNDRMKVTNIERYGVPYNIQREGYKEKMLSGFTEYVDNKRHKFEDVKQYFEDNGCELLETEYVNSITKMKFKAECGHVNEVIFDHFKGRGQRCNQNNCMTAKKMATNLEKFDKLWYRQTEECDIRIRETCLQKYGFEHPVQSPEIQEKIQQTNLQKYGVLHTFQAEIIKEKIKLSCLDKYGVEYYTQADVLKQKRIATNMARYGVPVSSQNADVQAKMVATNLEKYGVPYTRMNAGIVNKGTLTILDKYGVDNVAKSPDIRQKMMNTSFIRYGVSHPMQFPKIAEKSAKNAFKLKMYVLPSSKEIVVQGYEPYALDILLQTYDERDILTERTNVPEIWYLEDGKYRRYFCDIWIPRFNLIVEVKSDYTYYVRGFKNTDDKRKACEAAGYDFKLMLFDSHKKLMN